MIHVPTWFTVFLSPFTLLPGMMSAAPKTSPMITSCGVLPSLRGEMGSLGKMSSRRFTRSFAFISTLPSPKTLKKSRDTMIPTNMTERMHFMKRPMSLRPMFVRSLTLLRAETAVIMETRMTGPMTQNMRLRVTVFTGDTTSFTMTLRMSSGRSAQRKPSANPKTAPQSRGEPSMVLFLMRGEAIRITFCPAW